ncbi:hypothetical protein F5876DRAFT_82193 [Lentinula aff. lateritia]|uniref:Uncharacterized protein n=1 Tax=Lentinula aff. lateritia TaxID=2804960 RepID=A0ACC1TKR3_9AGAR|nr:hypothetical protein F5876DRAFT_82193 [Lentinula aff. lateritia]
MTTFTDADTLLKCMEGRTSTALWDMIVSYRCSKLNTLLENVWKADQKTDKINVSVDKKQASHYTAELDFDLGHPHLSFATAEIMSGCAATLRIPFAVKSSMQWYTKKGNTDGDPDVTTVENGVYELQVTVPLKNVTGDVKPGDVDAKATFADKTIHLGENGVEASHIILHFSCQTAVYRFINISGKENKLDEPLSDAIDKVKAWFGDHNNLNQIDYRLATVKSLKADSDPNGMLQPKSFIFAASGEKDDGVLSIFIQTVGSGSPPGNPAATFTSTSATPIHPIPKDQDASIIISHETFSRGVYLKQLEAYRVNRKLGEDKKAKEETVAKGFKYTFYLESDWDVQLNDIPQRSLFGTSSHFESFRVRLHESPCTLTIQDGRAKLHLAYTHDCDWYSKQHLNQYMGMGPSSEYTYGTVRVAVNIDQTTDFAKVQDTTTGIAVDMSITASSFKLTKTGIPGHLPPSDDKFAWYSDNRYTLDKGSVPQPLGDIELIFEDAKIVSPQLDLVAAESVLAPGMTIVHVDRIYCPYDVVLTGTMVEGVKA